MNIPGHLLSDNNCFCSCKCSEICATPCKTSQFPTSEAHCFTSAPSRRRGGGAVQTDSFSPMSPGGIELICLVPLVQELNQGPSGSRSARFDRAKNLHLYDVGEELLRQRIISKGVDCRNEESRSHRSKIIWQIINRNLETGNLTSELHKIIVRSFVFCDCVGTEALFRQLGSLTPLSP